MVQKVLNGPQMAKWTTNSQMGLLKQVVNNEEKVTKTLRERLLELMTYHFLALILGQYVVSSSAENGPFLSSYRRCLTEIKSSDLGRVDMSLKQTLFLLQFCAIYFIRDRNWS